MGLIRQVASIMMLGAVSSHTRREPPGRPNGPGRRPREPRGKPRRRPPPQRQHPDAHADRPSPGDVGRVMYAVHDPGHTHGRRQRPDRRRQGGHFQPDASGERRGGGVPRRNEVVTGVRPGRRSGGTSPAGCGLRTRPLARTLLAVLAITMPARPRRAAQRPRRHEVLDRAPARVVTGPDPHALLTTGALMGAR